MKFYLFFIFLMALSHVFVSLNFIYLFKISGNKKTFLLSLAFILFLISIFAKPLQIQNLNYFTAFLRDFFYIWLGIIWFLCCTLVVIDLFLIIGNLISPWKIDFSNPLFLKSSGYLAIMTTLIVSLYSVFNAKSATNLISVNVKIETLPNSYNNFKIVQLSDLHIGDGQNRKWLEKVVEITNSQNPDIIAITGDLVDGSVNNLKDEVSPLKNLKSKYGVFFVTGNHEFYSGADSWCNHLKSLNIQVLRNQAQIIKNEQGDQLSIAGIEDYSANSYPGYSSSVESAIKNFDKNIPIILLAHQPNAIDEAAKFGIKLQLSGHTHAGQIWPFNYFVKIQQPYVKGLHHQDGTALYISSGTGQWGPPMRFLTRTEITSINLFSK